VCNGEDSFDVSTAGDDMSLIADLGSVPMENFTTHKIFNYEGVASWTAYTRFYRTAKVEIAHTYALLVNTSDRRGLFVFHVVDYVPNRKVRIQYAVKNYRIFTGRSARSPGFDWTK